MSTYTSKTKNGSNLTIYWDESDPQNPGWAFRCGDGVGYWTGPIDDIEDLLTLLREHQPEDLDDLPTFGGDEPDDTEGVWSWDETSILVGTCIDDLKIVDRAEHVITRGDIEELLDEAAKAGDRVQVALCTRALVGDVTAWDMCCDVIVNARVA